MPAYRVEGTFRMGLTRWTPFSVETVGKDEAAARERVASTLGSRHNVTRRGIRIEKVSEVPADQVEDPVVRHALEKGA